MNQHRFNRDILTEVAHRPWPMPDRPWVMTQTWHDLLFAHWMLDPDVVRPMIPPQFEVDLFDGRAWIGVIPFYMTNVAPRLVPALPWISTFPELNVRTYVRVSNRPGVYFFSLDAGNPLAVQTAWILLNLPYYSASMRCETSGETTRYRSERRSTLSANFGATYAPAGPPSPPQPGTLEYFLTERYCLYALTHGKQPYRLEIHHPPWPLQPAESRFEVNTMAAAAGIQLPDAPPLLHFSKRQDMVAWPPAQL